MSTRPEQASPPQQRKAHAGEISRVAGTVLEATGLPEVRLYNVVLVGEQRLPGEVIRIDGETAVVQLYEHAGGLRVGDPVIDTGEALAIQLGPGLLNGIFDGTQRPLERMARVGEDPWGAPMIERSGTSEALDREREWRFRPALEPGARAEPGDVLGTVEETSAVEHRVLVPPRTSGTVTRIEAVQARVDDPVAWIDDEPVPMATRWPVREPRPHAGKLPVDTPLVTGQRVIDTLFPIARGGTATIPGGFGTGKTVLETSLAKWAAADVVVYVACGERGNELSEVLEEFPRLVDPRTQSSLMERTVLIANTSNMPVAAREASIYTGITIAEYFRDQGRHVALMADSTSRWGEALREVSSRLEEMPAEEGYPAYLATRLAEFYERAGLVECLGGDDRRGSVTAIGAVSPPGGDFSEPVTQHSLRLAGTFWALDTELARGRHFPAINWGRSYTLYELGRWFDAEVADGFAEERRWALELLQEEGELLEIVQLLGPDALAAPQRVVLRTGRLLREDFLRQSAFDEVDAHTELSKQHAMLAAIRRAHRAMEEAIEQGADVDEVTRASALGVLADLRSWPAEEVGSRADRAAEEIERELREL